jgi:hypothetical protein
VPAPNTRRRNTDIKQDYYGGDKSVFIEGVGAGEVLVCDLSDHEGGWAHTPPDAGRVALDPVLGRIAFPDPQDAPPSVTFHYGFSAPMGGGAYGRAPTFALPGAGAPGELPLLRVPEDHVALQSAAHA